MAPAAAHAATRYVRIGGNDANDGLSPARALRHITSAAAQAVAGDRIVVGPGQYNEGEIQTAAFGEVSFVADRQGRRVGDAAGDVVINATGFASAFELNRNLAVTIDGFVIYGSSVGIYVKTQSHRAVISNNIVSNTMTNGIYVQDSNDAVVFNNLVYNNLRTGILVTGSVAGSPGARIVNNTVYGNLNRGIYFSGTRAGSPDGLVINNIVYGNAIAGIQVNASSRDGYVSACNVTFQNRYASGTPVDPTDIEADPAFIDPLGPDHKLGGAGYADDNFRLSHRGTGQAMTSPAVNVGSDLARHLRLDHATTRTDMRPDRSLADAGYHYANFGPPPVQPEARVRFKALYVDPSKGDDANAGDKPSAALQSLARALTLVRPGYRLVLSSGRYQEGELHPEVFGKRGRPIILQGTGRAVIDAAGAERGILLVGASYLTLDGIEVTGATQSGIEIRDTFGQAVVEPGTTSLMLHRCFLHDNGRRGLYVDTATAISVDACTITKNGSRGIEINAGGLAVARTLVAQNPDTGLWLIGDSTVTVTGSSFVDNPNDGVLIDASDLTMTGGTVRGSANGGLRFKNGSTGLVRDVVVTGNTDVGVQGVSSTVDISGGRVEGSQVGIQVFVDPTSREPNDLAVTGTRICGHAGPGIDAQDSTVSVSDTTLCENGRDGLRQTGGSLRITGGAAVQNQGKGVTVSDAEQVAMGNMVLRQNQANGVQVESSTGVSIDGTVVAHNGGDGITVMDCPAPVLRNNLVYANGSSGLVVAGDVSGSPNAQVLNNTFYGNLNRGVLIGGSDLKPPSAGARVLRNIFRNNGTAGLQVNPMSLPQFVGDFNLTTDAYGPQTPLGPNDVLEDPVLVDPDNEDFHLSQRTAGQTVSSPAVDAGGVSVTAAGVQGMTTRSDAVPDAGVVDLGYHYHP
jgi:parallel beta-helix repeat protein